MDLLDARHRQHLAVRLVGELVGAVAGADRHRQRVHAGVSHEPLRLVGVGQELVVRQRALGAVAVLLVPRAGLQRAEPRRPPTREPPDAP